MTGKRRSLIGLALVGLALSACTGEDAPEAATPTTPATPSAAPPAPTAPAEGDCYRLRFRQALAPTTQRGATPCTRPHTSQTYRVDMVDTVVEGHLLAVDSDLVQDSVASACPAELSAFVGGTEEDLRLSMIRPVWFTPTVEESDLGADWYRCDAVVVASATELSDTTGSLEGILSRPAGERESVAMCGTAAPDADGFQRVPCAVEHTWRAIDVVDIGGESYPGEDVVRERGQAPCEDAGAARAEDPLDFQWGYEWPTAEQWETGMTFGRCWAPD